MRGAVQIYSVTKVSVASREDIVARRLLKGGRCKKSSETRVFHIEGDMPQKSKIFGVLRDI